METEKLISELNETIDNMIDLQNKKEVIEDKLGILNGYYDLYALTKGKDYIFDIKQSKEAGFKDNYFISIRSEREYFGRAFFLSNECDWELKRDYCGSLCLIPFKR